MLRANREAGIGVSKALSFINTDVRDEWNQHAR